MKTKNIILLGSALFSCLTTAALGQFTQPIRAGDILGSTLKDAQGQKAGTVKDLAVDLENGRIVEVVVAWGGFLGLNDQMVAAIPDNFSLAADGKSLRINMDRKRLEGAPAVDYSKWSDAMAQSRVEQVYQYYGAMPYFLVQEHLARGANPPFTHHLGQVFKASELIGTETMNNLGQKIGKVSNLIVDLPEDRAIEVIINSGRFLGMHDELSAVPPQALHFDADGEFLTLDETKEALGAAPHFSARSWPQIDRDQATAVYQAYHVIPYFLPIGVNSPAKNVPGDTSKTLAPLEQGTTQADLQITAKIHKELMDSDALSADAQNVTVITHNGRVTLRGAVANFEEKRLVGELAARIVPEADVDNQLEVKETASNAAK